MKKSILLPLFLGLLLAGCNRTSTDSKKTSSNDQSDASKPADTQVASATTGSSNQPTSNQPQVAAVSTPAPAASTSTTTTAATPATTPDTSKTAPAYAPIAANPTPAAPAPTSTPPSPTAADPSVTPIDPALVAPASTDMASASNAAKPDISARVTEWKLTPDDIKSEAETGRVVRSKIPTAGEPTGPMDSILVGLINTRLQGDADTSALAIGVEADKGVVTLTGSAHSLDQIGKAVALSLDTGGVTQAISLIKLETKPETNPETNPETKPEIKL